MLWKYILVNSKDLSHIGELSQARSKKLEVVLGKPGALSFTYPMNALYAEQIVPYKTGVKAMRWNRRASAAAGKAVWDCMWSGYAMPIAETVDANNMRSGSTPLQITYTPDVDCWWAVDAFVGGIAKDDAAYHYSYLSLNISPNDVDGFDFRQVIYTQHNQVQTYGEREIRHIFNLAAGTTYSCTMSFSANGGTWEYYQASLTCFLTGKAWAK